MTQNITPFSLEELNTEITKYGVSFLLKLTHELKTPIHGIVGISTYLSNNWDNLDDITRRKSVASIASASQNLAKLVDLLDKKNDQEHINFKFSELDLVKETRSVVEVCKNLYINKKDIEIQLEKQIDQCFSIADPFWYGQLLTNLLSNSINYSTKGTILVKFSTGKKNGINHFIVSVKDEGIGIPDAELNNVFDPYNRGNVENLYSKGAGLGLSICREIVEAHGGNISASNNQEIGSTIEFLIPIKCNE
jgi:signal transduction histidine kinase